MLPTTLEAGAASYLLRRATRADVPALVRLIAADQFGATRDDPSDLAPYDAAFTAIDSDPAHLLVSVESDDAVVVATMQLTVLPGLARRGATRLQIEAVRVAEAHRSSGLGAAMIRWAVAHARVTGCTLVQLTSDKQRRDAHRFYERLGFTASHEGYKLLLDSEDG